MFQLQSADFENVDKFNDWWHFVPATASESLLAGVYDGLIELQWKWRGGLGVLGFVRHSDILRILTSDFTVTARQYSELRHPHSRSNFRHFAQGSDRLEKSNGPINVS